MKSKRQIGIVILAGVCLHAVAGAQANTLKDDISHYEEEVAKARSHHDTRELIINLNYLASSYRQTGEMQNALACLNEALPIEQKFSSVVGQAITLNLLGGSTRIWVRKTKLFRI